MAIMGDGVVIVGGGIAGLSTAYFLARAGVKSVVVERDSVGSHASGFAYGSLSCLSGAGIPGPVFPLAREGIRLHHEFRETLEDETGVDPQYRLRPALTLAFTEREAKDARAVLPWKQQQDGYSVRWLTEAEVRAIEPRISKGVLGATQAEGSADVEPYRLMLALAQAVEKLGVTIRHGSVTGLKRAGPGVGAVTLTAGQIPCRNVVLAMGPWSGDMAPVLGASIEVRPLKGQILRLRAPDPPLEYLMSWDSDYATTKPDGLLWVGSTEEDVGFDANPTSEARDRIMASLLKVMPPLAEARLERQTACLRPMSSDQLPVLGAVPGWEGVYIATGAGRKGIVLGPAMGRIAADLVTKGSSDIPIEAFDPGRFGG